MAVKGIVRQKIKKIVLKPKMISGIDHSERTSIEPIYRLSMVS